MAYSAADDAFTIREPKKGDQVLVAFLNSDGEVTHVTTAVGLPVTDSALAGALVAGRLPVNPIVGQAGVAANAGAADVTTTRTVTASDSPEIPLLARWTPFRDSSVTSTGEALKASPGTLGHVAGFNKNAEDCWLHFYDAADVSGTPTYSLLVPKGDGTARGAAEISLGQGLSFATAIRYNAVTTASAANPGIALELVAGYI